MWPKYLDLDAETCSGMLRKLELEAYSSVVSALRAQGDLTKERRKILNDLSNVLNVSVERHKAEVRRAVNDEKLNTIAATMCGGDQSESEWAREGRRIIPLLRRATPLTAFSSSADHGKSVISSLTNRSLPLPLDTKTPAKRAPISAAMAAKHMIRPAPANLADMVTFARGPDNEENVVVRPPPVAVPALPSKFKTYQQYFGGDVVVLPSGMAVRIKEEKMDFDGEDGHSRKGGGRQRKRKQSEGGGNMYTAMRPTTTYEVFHPSAMLPTQPMMPPPWLPPPKSHQQQIVPPFGGTRGMPKSRRGGAAGRGGRKSKAAIAAAAAAAAAAQGPPQKVMAINPSVVSQSGHGYAREVSTSATSPSSGSPAASPTYSTNLEGLPKVVVVTTPSGTVLRTSTLSTTTATTSKHHQPQIIRQNSSIVSTSAPTNGGTRPTITSGTVAARMMPTVPHVVTAATRSGGTLVAAPAVSLSTSATITRTATPVKLKVGDASSSSVTTTTCSPMKVIPAGTRILPKTNSTGGGGSGGSTPVYMVASGQGQNVMRVVTTSASGRPVTLAGGQRVVTVNTATLKTSTGAPLVAGQIRTSPQAVRTLQPRGIVTSGGQIRQPMSVATTGSLTGNKPSVIVVQRSHGSSTAKTIVTKDVVSGQRIIQTKCGVNKPIVIVTKPSSTLSSGPSATDTFVTTTTASAQVKNSNAQQQQRGGGVVVLDLSQEQLAGNTVLSDILHATGIIPEDSSAAVGSSNGETGQQEMGGSDYAAASGEVHRQILLQPRSHNEQQQAAFQVPGESSYVVVGSNGSSEQATASEESQGRKADDNKMDIFSTAVASADIADFETNNIEISGEGCSEQVIEEQEIVTSKPSASNVVFASPHEVMPTDQQQQVLKVVKCPTSKSSSEVPSSTGESLDEIADFLTSNNDVQTVSMVVGEVGDEIVAEASNDQ